MFRRSNSFPASFRIGGQHGASFHFAAAGGFLVFTTMAVEISTAVWNGNARFKDGTLLVLLRLADYANNEGVCWPSIPRVAEFCRMSERQVQRILRTLESEGVVSVSQRGERHQCSIYTINVAWLGRVTLATSDAAKGDIGAANADIGGGVRVTLEADKLSLMSPQASVDPSLEPPKNHQEGFPQIPLLLATIEFASAWTDWMKYRKERKKPVTALAAKISFKELEIIGPQRAVQCIQKSIMNNWQGIFVESTNGNGFHKPAIPGGRPPSAPIMR